MMRLGFLAFVMTLVVGCGSDVTSVATTESTSATGASAGSGGSDGGSGGESSSGSGGDSTQPRVSIDSGDVLGSPSEDLHIYRGIPYAAPPVGNLWFRPPADVEPWSEAFGAFDYGPACPHQSSLGPTPPTSEDCLTVNVWAHADKKKRPVMVWIHGGGFSQGSSRSALYEGSNLARGGDVVVVSFNYRLGALGFLATEALAKESGEDSAGNYGTRDQIAALEWVKRNIAAFGGDPQNVTIFGESAGGISVCTMLGSPLSQGLYHRAIIQSGAGCYGLPLLRNPTVTDQPAVVSGADYVARAGCGDAPDEVACLRSLDADKTVDVLLQGQQSVVGLVSIGPNVDGVVLPAQPAVSVDLGLGDVPVMTGANADEMQLFLIGQTITKSQYEQRVMMTFGANAPALLSMYPAASDQQAKEAYVALLSDILFICPALGFARVASKQKSPAYSYHFTKGLTGGNWAALGAFHALEIAFVFNTFSAYGVAPTDADRALSETMMKAWSSFARTGVPALSPEWPAYKTGESTIAVLGEPVEITDSIREGRCATLATMGLSLAP